MGHSIATEAIVNEAHECWSVRTCWIPQAAVEHVAPVDIQGVDLSMERLSQLADAADAQAKLGAFVTQYRDWIDRQRRTIPASPARRRDIADELLNRASVAANRHTNTTTASDLVRRFAERFTEHQWPKGLPRPALFYDPRSLAMSADKRASLHAKCVIVDRREVFVSSANFTEAAHERNIEVGLLIHSRTLAERLVRHFEALLAEGVLKPVWDSRLAI